MSQHILIASGNAHKIQEIQDIMPEFTFISPQDINLDISPEEHGNSFLENAILKARAFYHSAYSILQENCIVLADDSGICIDALNGEPGIHSARYKQEELNHIPQERHPRHFQCLKILEEMKGLKKRNAHFICCAVLMWNEDEYAVYQARWNGKIIEDQPVGLRGFGYDPIFYLPEKQCTSAQLSPEEKNTLSHRALALRGLKGILQRIETFVQK